MTASLLGLCCSGCTTPGSPSAVESSPASTSNPSQPTTRQTDDMGRPLPFETQFPNRWSINNDGTSYEPCTQVPAEVVRRFRLSAESVSDVAASDFQTARGCQWILIDDGRSTISQAVGNMIHPEDGLSGHKQLNSAASQWLPDIEIDGRRVLVGALNNADCTVYVQSGTAVVATSFLRFGRDRPPINEICKTSEEFLRATIQNIPR
ncbi:DUF3558 domain-containing protein [Gordonia alkanivorans]|uniref:DUF3558 domain-containing protein n=1 Tax=Gordonia alkanivorans TaxID=84096 RepID=UPI00244D038A|nr:DUF3558 domain-containing protein [Gordonia alkanivorans]MDH3009373.1 DUF3558 domain-containing protein [Gordonia alkanivorans]MDH3014520.1 DUF3558 domain-containing protein [Gordonia alkanivorans]MDH3043612.1 DUF3558 domain-containing protein [Gordonia alkanivorans]